jgi:Domain of unknown function (DUF4124)
MRRSFAALAVRAGAVSVALSCVPGAALADLYTWTDERGTTVISNVMPANPRKVKDFEVVVKEEPKQVAAKPAPDTYERATTEKLLLDRIDGLEREIKAAREKTAAPPAVEPQYVRAQEYTADVFFPANYPSWGFPYAGAYPWGYPQTTVVIGSGFGRPNRGFRNFQSVPPGHVVSRPVGFPVSVPVTVPVSVPVSHPVTGYVKR